MGESFESIAERIDQTYPQLVEIIGQASALQELSYMLGDYVLARVIDPQQAHELRMRALYGTSERA